ncbi:MAG: peptidylprolyl isomerase [bacterium]|nr:peptidylprolyl isomerase [bacterium]
MLRALRKKTKPIIWVVAASFIGGFVYIVSSRGCVKRSYVPIAKIEGEEIAPYEFNRVYDAFYTIYGDKVKEGELKEMVLDELIKERLLLREAKIMGVTVNNHDIIDEVKKTYFVNKKGEFDSHAYNEYLEKAPASRKRALEKGVRNSLIINRVISLIRDSVKITDEDVKSYYLINYQTGHVSHILIDPNRLKPQDIPKEIVERYYNDHKDMFKEPEKVRVRHILISSKENPEEEARKKALRLLKMVKKGEDFVKLAEEYSDCPSKKRGGDLGFFTHGQMAKEFEDVAFSLKKGEVSDLVKTRFGYHIIKFIERREERVIPFKEAEGKVRKVIMETKEEKDSVAEKIAKGLLKRIKQGERFEEIAAKYSHGKSREFGGDLGIIPRRYTLPDFDRENLKNLKGEITKYGYRVDEDFAKAAFSLKEGEVSDVIKTQFGYHIIKLKERILPEEEKFQKMREDIIFSARWEKQNRIYNEWYDNLRDKAKIEIGKGF